MIPRSLAKSLVPWHVHAAGVCTLVLLTAATCLAFIGPAIGKGEQASHHQAQRQTQRRELAILANSNRDVQTALSAARIRAQNAIKLQSHDQLNKRLADLTQLATRHLLQIVQVAASKSAGGSNHGSVLIHCAVSGSYDACETFLAANAADNPDMAVIGLSAQSNPEMPDSPAALTIDFLWFIASDGTPPAK